MYFLAAAAAATAFNLVCSGTLTSESVALGKKTEPYSYTYRIDLSKNKYCDGECGGLHDIVRVQPTAIVLDEAKTDTPREQEERHNQIDRTTGKHLILYRHTDQLTGPMFMKWDGQCEKQPFSGFPTFNTKF